MNKFLFVLISLFVIRPINYLQEEISLNAPSACLIEPHSKKVIYEKDMYKKLYPASMTKMMGMYLILENLEKEKISFNDEVVVSSYACSMGGSQIFLEENEKMSVEDLFKGVCISSANDAIVALGEYIYSSNEAFVQEMNHKLKEFNLTHTNFVNATGFDDVNHYSCAYDMAYIGSMLVTKYPLILKYTSLKEDYIRQNTAKPFWLVNTNKLLKYYEGMDGLKTGYTSKAKYNLTSTACRNNVRFVSTIMHDNTIKERSQDTIKLLNYGFSKFKSEKIYNAFDVISTFKLKDDDLEVYVKNDIYVLVFKDEDLANLKIEIKLGEIKTPIKKDQEIGIVEITNTNSMTFTYPVYALNEIKAYSLFDYFKIFLQELFI